MTSTHLLLFASTFISVFALGFQSLNVRGDHYIAAFMTSFVIGGGNLFILRLVPEADAGLIAAYLIGGPFGIIASMWVHKRTIGKPTAMRPHGLEAAEIERAWRAAMKQKKPLPRREDL